MPFTTNVHIIIYSFYEILLSSFLVSTPTVLVSSGLQIPPRSLGYTYRTSNASREDVVTLTVYQGLTCRHSKRAFPTLLQVADELENENFELVVRFFSLPWHRNNHVLTEAVHMIANNGCRECVFPFLTEVYKNMSSLSTSGTSEMTDDEVLDIITEIGTKTSDISPSTFKSEISSYDRAARLDFKYACTRGVYGTPTFMVNDVVVDATAFWTKEQWIDLIKPLL